jgi:uncharacterized protein YegL
VSVLVTVETSRTALDVELDDTLPVAELLPEISAAVRAAPDAVLALADGTPVDPGTSLAAAGVLDGHRLTLRDLSRRADAVVLPCYVAVDTSDSVTGPALDVVNVELGRLADAFRDDSRVSGACRLAVATFDAEARVVLPLTPAADLAAAPALAATRPATNYESVFRLLRRQIGRDLVGLRMAGLRPLRPLVVFVTDGRPTRGYWPPAHAALTDPGWEGAADILAFGFGEASDQTVRRIGTAGVHLAPAGTETPGVHPAPRRRGRPGPAGLVAPVMSFVLDALGHPATAVRSPSPSALAETGQKTRPETGPHGWRSLHDLVR